MWKRFHFNGCLGFSGITVEFKQTADNAKGIFEIKDGVITAKSM